MTLLRHVDAAVLFFAQRIKAYAEPITSAMRERRITRYCREAIACQRAKDGPGARVAWLRMSREIEKRTPQQVLRMERERRIAARSAQ